MYDNLLMHHLAPDRPTNSSPYARKCSHGHMYYLLDTFGRSKSPTRLSGGWRRLVRQPSDAPPWPRSTVQIPLHTHENVPTGTCTTCLIPSAGRNRPLGYVAAGGELYDNLLMHHLAPDRPTNSSPYARKCYHGHMYYLLDTFGRSKSPTRLSGGWRRIVRQPSDAPPRARSTVDLHSIRTKMFPRAHVLLA